jgi:hypothetical protein
MDGRAASPGRISRSLYGNRCLLRHGLRIKSAASGRPS